MEFVQRIGNPNSDEIYIFVPENFKIKGDGEKKILHILNNRKNCIVYSDIEVKKGDVSIPQLYPSYNIDHNILALLPLYINTQNPIGINTNNPAEIFSIISKQIFGIHIPEILFTCIQQEI